MSNTVLEEALLDVFKDTDIHAQPQIGAARMRSSYEKQREPFFAVLERAYHEIPEDDRFAEFQKQVAARKLYGDASAAYETPPQALSARFWRHRNRVVLKQFAVEGSLGLADVLFLPPLSVSLARSAIRVPHHSVEHTNYQAWSYHKNNEEHMRSLEELYAHVDISLGADNYPAPLQKLDARLGSHIPTPSSYDASGLSEFVDGVAEYVRSRTDMKFSIS